ncbi:hypothetical protein [Stratiformator vulcanicus]|uniref:Uncharacterized protein n=1 Tax=Stratiformator vulcanicus TaxID=2527980 RepID=A0A517R0Q0_9PLAN|nr:hypothetical protein [Stratiformator vulcanicus]QDT37448.1 hypothetical protein Pan189_18280 [Stratiformator vulcanicus]
MNALTELDAMIGMFADSGELIRHAEHVPAAMVPENYRCLLAHDEHMTVAMEAKHESTVDVNVIRERLEGDVYYREITLTKTGTDKVVQYGLVKFDFSWVGDDVRKEILSKETPLGRVLIRHNVLRHVDLGALLRVEIGPRLASLLECEVGREVYGRLATIFCDGKPAVDLLEISAPLA